MHVVESVALFALSVRDVYTPVGAPASAIGDATQLLDVHVHELARSISFVAHCGGLRRTDQLPGHGVAVAQVWHTAAAQYSRHRAGGHVQLSANGIGAPALNPTQHHDLVLDNGRRAGGHGVWP